jgi:tetratricopeptide (TPR) repeat protein
MFRAFAARPTCLAASVGIALLLSGFVSAASAQLVVGLRGDDDAAYAAERTRLFDELAEADTEEEARTTESAIWIHWLLAPDLEAARLMDRALERRRIFDLADSEAILDDLVASAPDWAEGWNQRATIRYMRGDFAGSLADIDETLKREPKHFGALSGQAMIFIRQGRIQEAQSTLRKAVTIDPFLRERALIVEPPGRDI